LTIKQFEIFPGGLTITSNAAVESARCDTRYWLDFLLKASFDWIPDRVANSKIQKRRALSERGAGLLTAPDPPVCVDVLR
jgi:hypothetical protein